MNVDKHIPTVCFNVSDKIQTRIESLNQCMISHKYTSNVYKQRHYYSPFNYIVDEQFLCVDSIKVSLNQGSERAHLTMPINTDT